jgi:hypothetical protein
MEMTPPLGTSRRKRKSELEEFIDYAKLVMGTLGHKVFEKLTGGKTQGEKLDTSYNDDELVLYLKRKSRKSSGITIEAKCKPTNEGFVVLKGGLIETIDSDSIPPGINDRRKKAQIDESGILQEDVLFNSPLIRLLL